MTIRITATTVVLFGVLAGSVAAQERPARVPQPAAPQTSGQQAVARNQPELNVERLPLNIARLQRKLKESVEREERDGLRIRYTIDVVALAPPIKLVTPEDNVRFTPAPYGGPTHREMLDLVTPKEFRH